ncbi:MAG: antibiotic biosynthesis monooxygenase [Acidimicrobiales bacterium]|nr:antibiotic biosynthesis monooxygenase [Acidimicrobiales bacterium]
MSVIRINAITVPDGNGEELERRFAARAGEVDNMPGFEGFQLLRPVSGEKRWFVVTRWESAEAFENWVRSDAFQRGHARTGEQPAGTHAELLAFDIVLESQPGAAKTSDPVRAET